MTGSEIRRRFLGYFEERGHRVVASSSLVPERDPTLMFANAGMVQFKRVFLGEESRDYTRAATSQKCMRVSGKHNDLDDVGRSLTHHTFFEMLGNFSFGDYFKVEAVDFAWDLLTNVYGLDPDLLVVSVLHDDDETWSIWKEQIGLPEQRIFRLPEKENFWQMGDSGPCGPCSEIHLITDHDAFEAGADPSQEGFHEVWNLVFMQLEQATDGTRRPLPKPSVDTGMGLDRLAMILQGGQSTYDTDLFAPLLERAQSLSGYRMGGDAEKDVSLRVAADHARACSFLIGDGVLPSNEGRGYVLRRVLRRAARHGVQLGLEQPFLYRVADSVIETMGEAYPELVERRDYIEDTIRREELGRGLALLEGEVARLRRTQRRTLTGDVVFKLYDTFGFPVDLTEDILRGQQLDFDRGGFDELMREQAERARAAWKGSGEEAPLELYGELAREGEVEFTGYEELEDRSRVRAVIRDGARVLRVSEGERVELIAPRTPFYAQSGGQIGDTGTIEGPDGRIEIDDTHRPVDGLVVHYGRVALGSVAVGDEVDLVVGAERRAATVRNHSATHLLHAALKGVLGPQCAQAGSLVAPERTRFDFTHDAPLSDAQIRELEDRVNAEILANRRGDRALRRHARGRDRRHRLVPHRVAVRGGIGRAQARGRDRPRSAALRPPRGGPAAQRRRGGQVDPGRPGGPGAQAPGAGARARARAGEDPGRASQRRRGRPACEAPRGRGCARGCHRGAGREPEGAALDDRRAEGATRLGHRPARHRRGRQAGPGAWSHRRPGGPLPGRGPDP
jgi:alanyl-tRNA synthetase